MLAYPCVRIDHMDLLGAAVRDDASQVAVVVVQLALGYGAAYVDLHDDGAHGLLATSAGQVLLEPTVRSGPRVITRHVRSHVAFKDVVPWCLHGQDRRYQLFEHTGQLTLHLGCLGCLSQLYAHLAAVCVDLLLGHGVTRVVNVRANTAGLSTSVIVRHAVVYLVSRLVLGAGHVDAAVDELADLALDE